MILKVPNLSYLTHFGPKSNYRDVKFDINSGLYWPQMEQIWDFLRSVSVSQNVLKLILKSPRFVPHGVSLTQFGCKIWNLSLTSVHSTGVWHQPERQPLRRDLCLTEKGTVYSWRLKLQPVWRRPHVPRCSWQHLIVIIHRHVASSKQIVAKQSGMYRRLRVLQGYLRFHNCHWSTNFHFFFGFIHV